MNTQRLVMTLNQRGQTVCTAESLTAGLVSAALCDVPGASGCFRGGAAVYQDEVKESILGVSARTIQQYSAVSARCAREMAWGAAEKFGADYALSTTGYAGPGGEQVGLVFIGVHGPGRTQVHRLQFSGTRQGIRNMTKQLALYFLQKEIEYYGEVQGYQEGC